MRTSCFRYTILILILSFGALSSGCALFLVGAGAAGGYAISKDEIEGMIDAPFSRVWNMARNVLREEGSITLEDKTRGILEAEIEKSKVEIHIDQMTKKTVRLRVKARKTHNLFPDIQLAQKLYNQIVKKIK